MEARTRDGKKAGAVAPPRERLFPLSYVEFTKPVAVPGLPYPIRTFERGKEIRDAGCQCPKLFLDPELQAVVIEGRHYPIHLVHYYERAKAA